MIRCPSCGERISERARKCRYCGKSVVKLTTPGRRPQRRNGPSSRLRKGAEFSARVCLSEGHALLKKHYGLFLGAGLTVLISQALCGIPFVGLIVALFVFPHLLAGQWYIVTQAAAGRNPNYDDLFVGFRRYGTVLGVYLLLQLIVIACALPLLLGGIVAAVVGRLLGFAIGFIIFAVLAGVGVWLLLRFTMQFLFALAVAVNDEDAGVIDCFRVSAKMVQKHWLDLFFVLMVCSVTALLFGIGFLFWGLPLLLGAYGTAYHVLGGRTSSAGGRAPAVASKEIDELCKIVRAGDVQRLRQILQHRPHLARVKDGAKTLLCVALDTNARQPEIAKLLIAKGADVNAKNDHGVTPLHLNSLTGNKEIAALLLARGAKINVRNPHDGSSPLHLAAMSGREEIVQFLIAEGAKVNMKEKKYGLTPMHMAALNGHARSVQLLLSGGANPHLQDNEGFTPLQRGWQHQHFEVGQVLNAWLGARGQTQALRPAHGV